MNDEVDYTPENDAPDTQAEQAPSDGGSDTAEVPQPAPNETHHEPGPVEGPAEDSVPDNSGDRPSDQDIKDRQNAELAAEREEHNRRTAGKSSDDNG